MLCSRVMTVLGAGCAAVSLACVSVPASALGPASTDVGQGMPRLSASDTLALCFHRESADRTRCIGEFTDACTRLSPDGDTNAGMISCTAEEHLAWDSILNAEYTELMGGLEAGPSEALQSAQRAWIAVRDADCAFAASLFAGGSHAALEHVSCLRDETAMRTLRLQRWQSVYTPH